MLESKELYPEESSDINDDDSDTISDIDLPTEEAPEAPVVTPPPVLDIQYNNKTQLSYKKYGFDIPPEVDQYERQFLEDIDTRNGPMTRKVYKVVRCRGQDYITGKMKDYIYYLERWDGFDYLGNELPPVAEHVEGRHEEVLIRYEVDNKGRPKKSEPKLRGKRVVYDIPFTKQALDRIIKGVEKETIEFLVKIGSDEKGFTRRDSTYSYDQFANCNFAKLVELSFQPGGPRATPYNTTVLTPSKK